ncbi:alpha/beta hydrolase [Mycobacteroides salmoniphilum]|uniref:Acetyl-hydrolase LipR n=1 Tax=Mycobacteroides salmoniphilum TaxID=404941 RepID=A0A4R8SHR2_9MYCO|nr:alpha/beta hydrolase [Mycobacteroides salmoniphilum]TDZ96392.1 putative acetyl-hydrolase LipR precursor [Mycobacteroides salmoniphilum]TEA05487.1 putative acetyl-hydrolase LipR precursor [Mycobacteroides salmoniphilum]
MSLSMTLVRQVFKLRPGALSSDSALRQSVASARPATALPPTLSRSHRYSRECIGGFEVVTLRPVTATDATPHLVYLHGGAYVNPLIGAHWSLIAAIMRRVDVTVTVPMYPLAPAHTIDDALEFLDEVTPAHQHLNTPALVLCGDSAGGGLALSYAPHQRDTGRRPAAALVLFSPWVDVTMTNPAIPELEERDPILYAAQARTCGLWWAGSRDTADPAVSPLYADVAGLPPTQTFIGDHDILLPDAQQLHHRILEAGGASRLTVAKGGFHVYVGVPWLPESRRALNHTADIIRSVQNGI